MKLLYRLIYLLCGLTSAVHHDRVTVDYLLSYNVGYYMRSVLDIGIDGCDL